MIRSMIRCILTDIEGTTTPISFVHQRLFPYARRRLAAFCTEHALDPEVAAALDAARARAGQPSLSLADTIALLDRWIEEDRKEGSLKTIQGLIWRQGYQAGELVGEVYDDAALLLQRWRADGIELYVYSSGSEEAQRSIFGCSDRGDLAKLFSGFFDTRVGAKLEAASYRAIATAIDRAPREILFLTDLPAEVAAAKEAGLAVVRIDRALPPEAWSDDGSDRVAGSFLPVDRWLAAQRA